MDSITKTIIERRNTYTAARQAADDAADTLSLVEAELFLDCGYTALGKNDTERKAIFDNLKRNDSGWQIASHAAYTALHQKAAAADALAAAEDARRAYENELRRQWLIGQFGVNVDPAQFYSDIQF
jgi:hypothetical protein